MVSCDDCANSNIDKDPWGVQKRGYWIGPLSRMQGDVLEVMVAARQVSAFSLSYWEQVS